MMTFFRILLFAKVVLLTPEPIDIFGEVAFKLKKPLTAITAGASIQINISSMVMASKNESFLEFRRRVESEIPAGSIEATLIGKDKQQIQLHYNGYYGYSGNEVFLILTPDGGMPTDIEFEKLNIISRIKLTSVAVSWKNFKL